MKVSLVAYSKPVVPGLESPTDLVAYCARVSNPSNQFNTETAEKLIKYLIKHQHWSPLELATMCLEIETTRDIARQILRHRSFSFQEFCLSGDTEIYFAVPSKLASGSYKPTTKIKLADLYDKWANGAKSIKRRGSGNSIRMPMKKRLSDMHIKCFDEVSGQLTTSHIKEVFYTGKKPLYKIALSDGKQIKTTKEHKFLTDGGFSPLEKIVDLSMIGDRAVMSKIGTIAVNGVPVYQDKDWLLKKKQESLFHGGGLRYISQKYDVNYSTLRKWLKIYKMQYTKKETSIVTGGPWNKGVFGYNLPPKTEQARRNHQLSARKGRDSNLWRGGGSGKRKGIDPIDAFAFRTEKQHTCEVCGVYGGNLDIHHIVPVSENPSLENEKTNWQLLCRTCHINHHKTNNHSGWQAMGAKARKKSAYTVKWVTIDKIEYLGEQDTYDIEVDHQSHNYIANGIVTHNSQRYADPTKDLSFEVREARLQDPKNRQNSISDGVDLDVQRGWDTLQRRVIEEAKTAYNWAIENGIAKEQARAVLPEGLTMSRMYMSGTLRSWIHYIQLRSANGTQKEHMEIAKQCAIVISELFPLAKNLIESEVK
jgi:thymidylate synthase (FAD)